jgi:RNA polymerase sigma-70 factor (ECF subfamily)
MDRVDASPADSDAGRVGDDERIARAREDEAALGALLDGYRRYLTLLAGIRIEPVLRAKASASDVVQETLLRAYRGFDAFRGTTDAELTAWLRRILARRIVDLTRRYLGAEARDAFRERQVGAALDRTSGVLCALSAHGQTSPSLGAGRREMGVVLADALDALSDDHREVIVLRHLHGLSWAEVGAQMGRSPKAAGQLWVRALEKMRLLLAAKE